jgi:curved DNA-binding protein CbpA
MNFYAVLGIPRDADDEAIRNAYRILVRRYHPDRGIGSSAEKFRQVREAYETLMDPVSRRSYDVSLRTSAIDAAVRIEPMVSRSGPLPMEDPAVFGVQRNTNFAVYTASSANRFDRRVSSIDDLLFDSEWPW